MQIRNWQCQYHSKNIFKFRRLLWKVRDWWKLKKKSFRILFPHVQTLLSIHLLDHLVSQHHLIFSIESKHPSVRATDRWEQMSGRLVDHQVYYFAILILNDLPVLSIEFYLMETFYKTNTELLATLSSVFMTLLDLSACAVVMYRKAMPPVTF